MITNLMIQDAVIRNLEIIGEATKKLSKDFIIKNSQIKWDDIARTRDKLIHHYFGVNLDIIWKIINEDLVHLKKFINEVIRSE